VNSEYSEQERLLRAQIEESGQTLDVFDDQLRAVNVELEALVQKHQQYELLSQICTSLEQLDKLGAGQLFWEGLDSGDAEQRLDGFRQKIAEHQQEIAQVESRREDLVEQIGGHNQALDCLHYDLQDIIEEEERKKNEWMVERDLEAVPQRVQIMPWARGGQEDQRFRRSLATSIAASLGIAFLLGTIALPIIERDQKIELPERMAKLVRQERTPPPAPPPEPEKIEELPEPEPEPEPKLVEEQPPEPMPVANEEPVVAEAKPLDTKEQVKSKGILAFRDSFANRADARPAAQLGSQATLSNAGESSVGRPERMMVASNAPGSSGGINIADISRDIGGGGGGSLEGVAVSRVESSIGGGDGPDRPLAGGARAGRTDEEIQIIFDRYKASLYRLYNRELRKDPTLRGQLVLQLTIEPDGSVSMCQLHKTDMNAPGLADQVVNRVGTFDFGAKEDISAVTIIYPIDFLPAA